MSNNSKGVLSHSLVYISGIATGILFANLYLYKTKKKRFTKTHYNIIINDKHQNELLESYYIDYKSKKIYFEKNLENVDVIFYTTNSQKPIYTKKNFTGDHFLIEF